MLLKKPGQHLTSLALSYWKNGSWYFRIFACLIAVLSVLLTVVILSSKSGLPLFTLPYNVPKILQTSLSRSNGSRHILSAPIEPDTMLRFFRRKSTKETEGMDKYAEVILLGDSIINRIQDATIWTKFAKKFRCLNLGIDGLTVEGLLRRLVEGDFSRRIDGFDAKAVVLLIGTNNVADPPQHIASKIGEIVDNIRLRQPTAVLFVIELFPKGPVPSKYRDNNTAVNTLIRDHFADVANVRVINLDPGFVDGEGRISRHDLVDGLHFSDDAYEKAFSPLYHELSDIMQPARVE